MANADEISHAWTKPVSLALLAHFSCVIIALFGSQMASLLQSDAMYVIAAYTRPLHLEPAAPVRLHLTHALEEEDDHCIEIRTPGEAPRTVRLPDPPRTGWRWGWRHDRWRTFAGRVALLAAEEDEEVLPALTRDMGHYWLDRWQVPRVTITCLRQPPIELAPDPMLAGDQNEAEVVYQADIFRSRSGAIRVLKRVAPSEAAPALPPTAPGRSP